VIADDCKLVVKSKVGGLVDRSATTTKAAHGSEVLGNDVLEGGKSDLRECVVVITKEVVVEFGREASPVGVAQFFAEEVFVGDEFLGVVTRSEFASGKGQPVISFTHLCWEDGFQGVMHQSVERVGRLDAFIQKAGVVSTGSLVLEGFLAVAGKQFGGLRFATTQDVGVVSTSGLVLGGFLVVARKQFGGDGFTTEEEGDVGDANVLLDLQREFLDLVGDTTRIVNETEELFAFVLAKVSSDHAHDLWGDNLGVFKELDEEVVDGFHECLRSLVWTKLAEILCGESSRTLRLNNGRASVDDDDAFIGREEIIVVLSIFLDGNTLGVVVVVVVLFFVVVFVFVVVVVVVVVLIHNIVVDSVATRKRGRVFVVSVDDDVDVAVVRHF
jgi:hypothetical protein